MQPKKLKRSPAPVRFGSAGTSFAAVQVGRLCPLGPILEGLIRQDGGFGGGVGGLGEERLIRSTGTSFRSLLGTTESPLPSKRHRSIVVLACVNSPRVGREFSAAAYKGVCKPQGFIPE